MKVYTQAGQKLTLAEPPLGRGGEATVYRIAGKPDYVAKLYKSPALAREREAKVKAMIDVPRKCSLPANLAWPFGYLQDASGTFLGFYMKGVRAKRNLKSIYAYPPKNVSVNQKLAILISLCDTFESLHACNQAVGDGNPENIKVLNNCTVVLLDTDSFAVTATDGKLHRCLVCLPEYPAPEMLRAAKGTTYDTSSKAFGIETDLHVLAIHVFRMLFNGAHPFQYARVPGQAPAGRSYSIEDRVERGESPYFHKIAGFSAPAFAPALDAFPPYLRDAFKRAFVDGNAHPAARPTAREWRNLLIRFAQELTVCSANGNHFYWNAQKKCPYCAADTMYRKRKTTVMAQAKTAPGAMRSSGLPPVASQAVVARAMPVTQSVTPAVAAVASAVRRPTSIHAFASNAVTATARQAASSVKQATSNAKATLYRHRANIRLWLITVLSSVAVVAVCLLAPFASMFYLSILGTFETWMTTVGAAAGLGASCAYNHWVVQKESWYHYALSPFACAAAFFATAIVIALVWQLVEILAYVFGCLLALSIAWAFISEF